MEDRKVNLINCDVFCLHDFCCNEDIAITGNFYACCGSVAVNSIEAGGDIIISANVIETDSLKSGGKIEVDTSLLSAVQIEAIDGCSIFQETPYYLEELNHVIIEKILIVNDDDENGKDDEPCKFCLLNNDCEHCPCCNERTCCKDCDNCEFTINVNCACPGNCDICSKVCGNDDNFDDDNWFDDDWFDDDWFDDDYDDDDDDDY